MIQTPTQNIFRTFWTCTYVIGMSLGCLLDGTVIAYSSPALPSLFKKELDKRHGLKKFKQLLRRKLTTDGQSNF